MKLLPTTSPLAQLPIQTLLLPAATPENVGELAIDAIIATYGLQRVACLESDYVLPAAGNDPYTCTPESSGDLTTSLELYANPTGTLHALQQRAPVALGAQSAHAADLAAWLLESGVAQVILVSNLPSTFLHDPSQPPGMQYDGNTDAMQQACSALGWQPLDDAAATEERTHHGLLPPWPLLKELADRSIGYTMAALFVADGSNLPAATMLAEGVVQLLCSQKLLPAPQPLQQPCSWVSVFGRPLEQSLYTV